MKVKSLIEELNKIDGENDLFLEVDGKLFHLETVRLGQFFKSNVLSARVDFDIVRAEQTLLSALQFSPEALTGTVLERLERAMGSERVRRISDAFNEHMEKTKQEQEDNKELIEEIQESINRQEVFQEEAPTKKAKAKKPKKIGKLKDAEAILARFYSGDKSDGVDLVKSAKALVGEERATEIFNEVRKGK